MKIDELTKFFTGQPDGRSLCLGFDRATFKGRQGDDVEYARLLFLTKRPGRSMTAQNVKVQQDLINDIQAQFDAAGSDEVPGVFVARVDVDVVNDNADTSCNVSNRRGSIPKRKCRTLGKHRIGHNSSQHQCNTQSKIHSERATASELC